MTQATEKRLKDYAGFMRIRGDTAVLALQEMRKRLEREIKLIDTALAHINSIEQQVGIVNANHKENLQGLIQQVREMYPNETQGLTDEQAIEKLGAINEAK